MGAVRLGIETLRGVALAVVLGAVGFAATPAVAAGGGHSGGWSHGGGGWHGAGGGGWHGGGGWGFGRGWGPGFGFYLGGAPFGYYPGYYGAPAYCSYPYAGYAYGTYPYANSYYPVAYPPASVPPPPPRQAAQPVPPGGPASFEVYFDFDKSDITPAAAAVIRRAADSMQQRELTRISVVGHTDTVGTSPYNQNLSERRAESVRRTLVADGVPADEVEVVGVGKTGLSVATAENVREPRNRRVEIVLPQAGESAEIAYPPASAGRSAVRTADASCRDFQMTIMVDGQQQPAHGTACEQPDGTWKVVRWRSSRP